MKNGIMFKMILCTLACAMICSLLVGCSGPKGDRGDAGVSVVRAYTNDERHLILDMSDGSVIDAGYVGVDAEPAVLRLVLSEGELPNGVPNEIDLKVGDIILLPTPELEGKIFEGWFTEGGLTYVENTYCIEGSVTLYGKWRDKPLLNGKAIYTIDDLAAINDDLGGSYVLMNDIDCKGLAIPTIGADEESPFRGVFDGNGKTIYGFAASPNRDYVGLFGYNAGVIRDLKIADYELTVRTHGSGSKIWVGGVVGYNANTIANCCSTNGKINVELSMAIKAGAITGENSGTVRNCYASGNVRVNKTGTDDDVWGAAGGICAVNRGSIDKCYSNSVVFANGRGKYEWYGRAEAAGISATNENNATIENCLVFGAVEKGSGNRGDIAGRNDGTITNCYKDDNFNIADGATHTYATVMTRASLSSPIFYRVSLMWDSTIWDYDVIDVENGFFPVLRNKSIA